MNYEYLNNILSPHDIKDLSTSSLNALADEIRHRIIDVLSITGGHLASNLGIVELTLALHKVFNSPIDKFIWDVSHQTYVHKIITGRNERLSTIRQYKGLSGFSHPHESEHDHFFAGHAGTALSLAMGMAKNRDLFKRDEFIIPIIGDATLTCGLALEGLNNIDRDLKKFIVILNDNEMSISKNVGAITKILSRLINHPTVCKIYEEVDSKLNKLPGYGKTLSIQGRKIASSLKNLVSPATFFEQFELTYIGPIDGHNIKELIQVLEGVKTSQWPVLVHVLTKKGQGMEEAIKNPVIWHGAKPFCQNTNKFLPSPSEKPTFPKVFGEHIYEMAKKDPKLICITPAMSAGSCLDKFMSELPNQCIDVGIAESHAVTFAGGVAKNDQLTVFLSIYSTFFQRAFDNLFHDVCLQEIPVIFCVDRAGIAAGDGQTHNGIYDISFLNAMPNMIITQPRNGHLLKELLQSSPLWKKPTAIRYPNLITHEEKNLPLKIRNVGKGEILQQGSQILIIALGHMVNIAFQLSQLLEEFNICPTIIDPIFIKPLDIELIKEQLSTHSIIITIEEHSLATGLGSIINNLLINDQNYLKIFNFGVPDVFVEQGKYDLLMEELGLTSKQIFEKIKEQIQNNSINSFSEETLLEVH